MHADALAHGERALIVDDVIATGGTARATCDLVARLGAVPVGAAFLIELSSLDGASKLAPIPTIAMVRY
jgi:adenine phosphoribosyltransferase